MSFVDAYSNRREAEVMQDTWGHLAPQPGQAYGGSILFTHGCYGDLTAISVAFDGLDDSPWFYEHLLDWLVDQDTAPGQVYRFTGTYCLDRGDRFIGEVAAAEAVSR